MPAIEWALFPPGAEITHALRGGALEVLRAAGVTANNTLVHGAGAFELLANPVAYGADQPCDAVIAIGTVIRGETAHFDYVCEAASEGSFGSASTAATPPFFVS